MKKFRATLAVRATIECVVEADSAEQAKETLRTSSVGIEAFSKRGEVSEVEASDEQIETITVGSEVDTGEHGSRSETPW